MHPKAALLALVLGLGAAAPALADSELTLSTRSDPPHAQDFTYVINGQQVVRLDYDLRAAGEDNALSFMAKIPLAGGSVEIVESPVTPGWALTRIICEGGMPSQVNLAQHKVVAVLPAWCTFVHKKVAP
jgi:hypothetical protein